ncbi:unnamed protein product [Paramecium sonneborni]|uniref:Geranylgeranyl diphosphate synthase n=1 Tax=Paramecium sonneborni TaxID=65129 RepID=A0A8S1NC67_9CILI|nr:unnamed protein product [Paramecium sonneborni]
MKNSIGQFMADLKHAIQEFEESKIMEEIVPRKFNNQNVNENQDMEGLTQCLSVPLYDLLDRGGKRIRPYFCMLIADLFLQSRKLVYEVAGCVEIIHNGTLIIDDIEDSSKVRRNDQCIHIKYGLDVAANASSYAYFAPLQYFLNKTKYSNEMKLKILQICIQNMTEAHLGQAWDIKWHRSTDYIPTEEQYIKMVGFKTGALLKIPALLSCAVLGIDDQIADKLSNFAEKLGVAFQIQDDILNLIGNEKYKNTKGYLGEDINEGKLTLIVIHSLSKNKGRLLEILNSRPEDQKVIDEAIKIIQSTGSLEYAQKKSEEILQSALKDIDQINFENLEGKQKLRNLALFLIQRNY